MDGGSVLRGILILKVIGKWKNRVNEKVWRKKMAESKLSKTTLVNFFLGPNYEASPIIECERLSPCFRFKYKNTFLFFKSRVTLNI